MIYKIVKYGNPVLEERCDPIGVAEFGTFELKQLVQDMFDTMYAAKGVGLAAPQIGLKKRLTVIDPTAGEKPGERIVLINPEITPLGEEIETAWEGCLSIPGLRGAVPRPARIRFRALNQEGAAVEGEAEGIVARVIQHENDHLNGVLYLSRMPDLTQLGFTEELARREKETA